MRIPSLMAALLVCALGCAQPQLGPGPGTFAGAAGAGGGGGSWPIVPPAPEPEVVASGLAQPCAVAIAGDSLLVADEALGHVLRVPLAGGAPVELIAGLAAPTGLAASGDDLFVTERAAGLVLWIHLGTAVQVASGEVNPGRLRVAGGSVFWLAEGTGAADGALRRARIGSSEPPQTIAAGLVSPKSLAVAGRVYFTEPVIFKISSVAADGGDELSITDAYGKPFDVAVDDGGHQLLWSALGKRGGGWIHRAGLDFSTDVHVSFSPPGPEWLALAGANVVWSTFFGLAMAPRSGGGYQDLALGSVCDFAIADGPPPMDEYVYWTDSATGRVLRVALPGK